MTKLSVLERKWRKDPAFVRAYDALETEYALIEAVIRARVSAGLTQTQLARRMKTTQSAVARLEGGQSKPTTATLNRLAAATGTRLKISFEPVARRGSRA